MAISFGGVDLLLHDLDGEVQSHVDRFMAENQTHWFGRRSPAEESLTQASIQRHPARVPMPCLNWPTPPQPRINTLYYPVTGATRWSVGLFLIDQERYDSLGITGDGKAQFTITANQSRTFTENANEKTQSAYLYPLTPKPLATSSNSLLILPLVDVRYFWQFIDAGNTTITADTKWDDLETIIRTQISDTVGARAYDAAYFKPDPLEFNRKYLNIAQLIDAVCASTGQRFYYDLFNIQGTESFGIENNRYAEMSYSNINFTKANLLAGGIPSRLKCNIPAQVNTIFPHHVGRLPTGEGGIYSIANGPSTTSNQPTGTEWNIFTTAAADMTGVAVGYAANNAADLSTLATKISEDIYAWQQRQFDYTVAGLAYFSPSAYEDYRLYDFRGTIQTRVASLPPNVGPYTNWCQVPGAAVDCCTKSTGDDTRANELWPGPKLRVRLTEKLIGCGSAKARPLYFKEDGTVQCDAKTITIYDPLNKVDSSLVAIPDTDHKLHIPVDSEAEVTWHNDAKRWEVDEFGTGCNPCDIGSHAPPPHECGVPCPPPGCGEIQAFSVGNSCYVYGYCCSSGSESGSTATALGLSCTVTLRKLTDPGGTDGSLTFVDGILTAKVDPT